MKKRVVNMLSVLPEELIGQILTSSGLDLKDMIKCKLVCTRWRNLISGLLSGNPLLGAKLGHVRFLGYDFVHHRFGALDEETQEIVWMKTLQSSWRIKSCRPPSQEVALSSCNGLVCFVSPYHDRSIYICNPVLGEHIRLSQLWAGIVDYFLGFCPSSNEYKLVGVRYKSLEILTLGTPDPDQPGAWRTVPLERPAPEVGDRAVFVSGVLHWLLKTQSIFTLDLAKEVLGSTPLPRLEADKEMYQLGCMDRCLVATAGYRPPGPPKYVEIWVRKEDKSSSELVWTKNWVIGDLLWSPVNYRFFVPRKLSADGRVIMTCHVHDPLYNLPPYSLYTYDPSKNLLRRHPCPAGQLHAFDYTPTLVSPTKIGRQG